MGLEFESCSKGPFAKSSTHGQRHENKLLSKLLLPITITKEPVVWESVLNLERHAMRSVPRITLSGVFGFEV